jgi:ferritin-like metal-binding protein YciE
MSLRTGHDLLLAQLRELYSAERQITRALPKLAAASFNGELSQALLIHLAETEGQVSRLERIFEVLGVSPKAEKSKSMAALLADGADTVRQQGRFAVIDAALIADAQRVEHYEIAAYGSAKALAELLGLADVAKLLNQSLAQEIAAEKKLTEIADHGVNREAVAFDVAA